MITPTPINEAEAVFQRFFDPYRCYLEEWKFEFDKPARSTAEQRFHASVVKWQTGGGRIVGRLSRDVQVDVSQHDRLIVCCTLPSTTKITVKLIIDGQEQTPIDSAPGENTSAELEGLVQGEAISRVTIELTDEGSVPSNAQLFWLGLAHSGRLKEMQARPNPWKGSWDDLAVPDDRVELKPVLGLLFDEGDLARLRAKVARSPYSSLMDRLRVQAREGLGKEPWRGVGTYPNMPQPRCYRFRSPEHIDLLAMRLGAFVGLIDNDHELSRMAIDHALALAYCDKWQPEFLATIAGSSWEQRAFHEYRYAQNLIFAWDWAGSHLTDAGRQLLAQAVSTKGLPWILQTLMRHPYVRGCNQGVYFSWGAIICELALASLYPYATEFLDAAVKALDQTVTTYFAEDGGAFEGVGYGTSTAGHALAAYALVARHKGVALDEVVPPVLKKARDYIMTMVSTKPPFGSAIKVADGGREGIVVYQECLGLLVALTKDEAIGALLSGMLAQKDYQEYAATPGAVFNIVFGPDELPPPRANPPTFSLLPQTGMLCSNRPTEHGPVRLQLIGGPAKAGHAHDDRGSFVIEAFGEEIAMDRGQMPYDDPRCESIKLARYHNVLIPEGPDDLLPRQLNPCPAPTIPAGTGDEKVLSCSIDVTAAWGGLVASCVRRIGSASPTEFVVIDSVELPEERRVSFHLHSKFPWTRTDTGWVTRGEKAQLTVEPEWSPVEQVGEEDFVDGLKEPVYHLTLFTARATQHELRTPLHLSRA